MERAAERSHLTYRKDTYRELGRETGSYGSQEHVTRDGYSPGDP